MKNLFALLLFIFCSALGLQAQTQIVRGVVSDKQSGSPLAGAVVSLRAAGQTLGAATDVEGNFQIPNVPLGRQAFVIHFIGYADQVLPNVEVTSGKEVVLRVFLEESLNTLDAVVVKAEADKDKARNEMATISARSFNVEEVQRFSGGRNDVSRLVGNFAGVAVANDSRNDIVVRGNSPTGVLWRIEGVPTPNPNHFSTLGTTGGPVSALNPNMIGASDFLTSAFPAEYGNALAGVFDINFRNGNKDKNEYTFQLAAFSGLEAMAEGPLNKASNGSYLIAFRNSFTEVANAVGLNIGTKAVPVYRDLTVNIDLGNTKYGKFSVFGIAGASNVNFLAKETEPTDIFADPTQDDYVKAKLGLIGLKHNYLLDKNTYIRTVLSASAVEDQYDAYDYVSDQRIQVVHTKDVNQAVRLSSYINKKYNARMTLRAGFLIEHANLNAFNQTRENAQTESTPWVFNRDDTATSWLTQAYAQAQYRFNSKLTFNAGLHTQYSNLNQQLAVEPRLALNWHILPNQTINFGYGLHHQTQSLPTLFYQAQIGVNQYERTNIGLDYTRANHFVVGYDVHLGNDWRAKLEAYYQALDQVPVETLLSSYSVLNDGSDFVFPKKGFLKNTGTGANKGLELTVEKFFSDSYYGLFTGSLYDSKYKGSDGVERNTAFNGKYTLNILAGREIKMGAAKRNALTLDTKLTAAGGRYYTPVDLAASQAAHTEIFFDNLAFSEQSNPYFRLDFKIGYLINSATRKFSQHFYIDLENITNHVNVFQRRYNKATNQINDVKQIGFFPDILYRIQF